MYDEKTHTYRFAVNPLGAQYDSRDWDPGWDGAWQAAVKRLPEKWVAEIALPFEILGAEVRRGTTWRMDFRRNRSNIRTERSAWAAREDGGYGHVTFH